MADPIQELDDLVTELSSGIAERRQADVYFYAGSIERPYVKHFSECVLKNAKRPNALLLLTTFGGSGDAAYQMARCEVREEPMRKYAILAQVEKDRKMEAELQQLREQQEQELQELERVRREMETAIEKELQGKIPTRWRRYPEKVKDFARK